MGELWCAWLPWTRHRVSIGGRINPAVVVGVSFVEHEDRTRAIYVYLGPLRLELCWGWTP